LTYDAFILAHPEFSETNANLVSAMLAQATRRADPRVFGATIDDYIGWETADLLARSPEGFNTRLKPGQQTMYRIEADRMIEEAAAGIAVTAGPAPLLPGRFGCW
jgi:hypothetical protein